MFQKKKFYWLKKNASIHIIFCLLTLLFCSSLQATKTLAQNISLPQNTSETVRIPILGKQNAPISVVYFFDYNCSFCKDAFKEIELFLSAHKEVRFLLKDFPVIGQESKKVHAISLAVFYIHPEKYKILHHLLVNSPSRLTEKEALRLAKSIGLTEKTIYETIEKYTIEKQIQTNITLAETLGVRGTPAYIIGENLVLGALNKKAMETKILEKNNH